MNLVISRKFRTVNTLTMLNARSLIKLFWGVLKLILTDKNFNFLELWMWQWVAWMLTSVRNDRKVLQLKFLMWCVPDIVIWVGLMWTALMSVHSNIKNFFREKVHWDHISSRATSCSGERFRGTSASRLCLFYIKLPFREQYNTELSPGKTSGWIWSIHLSWSSLQKSFVQCFMNHFILSPLTTLQRVRADLLDAIGKKFTCLRSLKKPRLFPDPSQWASFPWATVLGWTTLLSTGTTDLWQIFL